MEVQLWVVDSNVAPAVVGGFHGNFDVTPWMVVGGGSSVGSVVRRRGSGQRLSNWRLLFCVGEVEMQ